MCFGDLTRSFTFSLCGDLSLCERLALTGDRLLGERVLSARDLSLRADGLCLRGVDTRSLTGERDLVCPDLREEWSLRSTLEAIPHLASGVLGL